MHRRDERDVARVTRWWARLAGAIAGLAGLGVAGLAAWLIAPAGSPVPAVGELIIEVLPAPLVNFGKEVLGFADKPVLLTIIVAAVLIICGLAGELELRRRFAGAALFAVVAVIGLIGVGAQPEATINAYVPTIIGLLLGYMILSGLIRSLQQWRPPDAVITEGEAGSAARRRFLGWTILVGVGSVAAAVTGQLLASASSAVDTAREKLKLPPPTKPTPGPPPGADLQIEGLTPYVTSNDDFYRIDTALQVPMIDPAAWTLRITGLVQNPIQINYAELTAKPLVEHMTTLTCVSNEVGGDLAGNALWLGYPIRELLGRGEASRWRRHGALGEPRRLECQYAAVGPHRPKAGGDPGHRHERSALAHRARIPSPHGRSGPLRLCVGDEMGDLAAGHHLRRRSGLLDAARLVAARSDQAGLADRCATQVDHRSAARLSLPESHGPSTPAYRLSRFRLTRAPGSRRSSPRPPVPTPGGSGNSNGRQPPARTGSPFELSMRKGCSRQPRSRRLRQMGPPATTQYVSRSADALVGVH